MPHDPLLEQRLADALEARGAKTLPKKMFGGVAFMLNGNMCLGVTNKNDLMVRFAPERHAEVQEWTGAKPMTFGKSGMKGFLFVDPSTVADRKALERCVKLALDHVGTLPKKVVGGKATARKPAVRKPMARKSGKATRK